MRTTTPLAFASALLGAAGSLCAQLPITGDLRTVAPYGNFAREGTGLDFKSWPAATILPANTPATLPAASGNGSAATTVTWSVSPVGVSTCEVSEQGGGTASAPITAGTTDSPTVAALQQGAHELRLVLRGAPGLRGKIEAWASGIAGLGAIVTLALDIGDDSSIDFTVGTANGFFGLGRQQWDRGLDASGILRLRIVTSADLRIPALWTATYKADIGVRFTPGAFCDIGPYGQSCGAVLVGYDDVAATGRKIGFQLIAGPASSSAVLVLGLQRVLIALPGTACQLLADPLVLIPFTTDATGSAQQSLLAPPGPLLANAQHVVVAPWGLTSSNGLAIGCR
jgi:hypothetical protein